MSGDLEIVRKAQLARDRIRRYMPTWLPSEMQAALADIDAALSRLEAQPAPATIAEPAPPVECPARQALRLMIPKPGTEYARDGHRDITLDQCPNCGAMCERGSGPLEHIEGSDCYIAQCALSTPCSPCPECAASRQKGGERPCR